MAKYLFKKIDEVRNDIIDCKITDIEKKGRVIYCEDKEGRMYAVDFTGQRGAVVNAFNTDKENLEILSIKFDALMQKLNIKDEEIQEFLE